MSYCSLSDLQGLHKGNIGGSVGCMGCRCVVLLVHCALLKCRICRAPLTLMPRVRVASCRCRGRDVECASTSVTHGRHGYQRQACGDEDMRMSIIGDVNGNHLP